MPRWMWAFIDRPMDRFKASATFWSAVTDTTVSPRRGTEDEFATLLPSQGAPCLKLQGVHGQGGTHLDLGVEDVPAGMARVVELGGTVVGEFDGWSVARSPGGMTFCLVPWDRDVTGPPVVSHQDGGASRLDQVCIDVGPSNWAIEVDFWSALTGWEAIQTRSPEFKCLDRPEGFPIRILLQLLDSERESSAHLDFACDDVEAVRTLHESHGASTVEEYPLWTVMADPTGWRYCLTRRDPRTGQLPTRQ